MPTNNPFDKVRTKHGALFSNIAFAVTVALVVLFVIYVFVKQPENIKSDYLTAVIDTSQTLEEENEYKEFCDTFGDKTMFGEKFKSMYPTMSDLLTQGVGKSGSYYGNSTVALFKCYNATADETQVTLDILLVVTQQEKTRFALTDMQRYTIKYDKKTGVIMREELRKDKFKISFETISFERRAAVTDADYKMSLSYVISDKQAQMDGLMNSVLHNTSVLKREDNGSVLSGTAVFGVIEIRMTDLIYDFFDGLEITGENMENITIRINS